MKPATAIILLFLASCRTEVSTITFDGHLSGKVSYVDLNSGKEIKDQQGIEVNVRAEDNSSLPDSFVDSSKGFTFQFGPLDATRRYIITAKFVDSTAGITYEATEVYNVGTDYKELILLPTSGSLFLLGTVKYTDVLENRLVTDQEMIKTTIKSSSGLLIGGKESLEFTGPTFRFSGLSSSDKYDIKSVYLDQKNMIQYSVIETEVIVDGKLLQLEMLASENSSVINGNLYYNDVLTDNKVESFDAKIAIRRSDGLNINGVKQVVQIGNAFSFVGLTKNVKYKIDVEFTDLSNVNYGVSDQEITASGTIKSEDIEIKWIETTSALVTVKNSNSTPTAGVQVFAFDSYEQLKKYRSNPEASISRAVSNSLGRVLFSKLTSNQYFFYGEKVIGKDTLNTFDPLFDPVNQKSLKKDEMFPFDLILHE